MAYQPAYIGHFSQKLMHFHGCPTAWERFHRDYLWLTGIAVAPLPQSPIRRYFICKVLSISAKILGVPATIEPESM